MTSSLRQTSLLHWSPGWPDTTLEVIESTDHFLVGRAASIATRVVAWLDEIV